MPKIKKIYVGTKQVRPVYTTIECDFTQGDNGFTYVGKNDSHVSYGRDANGLYLYTPAYYAAVAWKIPSSIYQAGTLKKIVFELKATGAGCGGGICLGVDTAALRTWYNRIEQTFDGYTSVTLQTNSPADTIYTLTIDIENKQAYTSFDQNNVLSLSDNVITSIQSNFTNGNLNICVMGAATGNYYAYMRKATFYIE